MYAKGTGVPEDKVNAYAWYSAAAAQGDKIVKNGKGIVEGEMTLEQIAEAQKLSSELWEKYVVPFQMYQLFTEAAHMVMYDQEKEFNRMLASFCKC